VAVLAGDLGDLSLGAKVVDLALKSFGRLDGLVVNHGVLAPVSRISETKAEDWSKAFDINVFSAVAMVKTFDSYLLLYEDTYLHTTGQSCAAGAT
jgi:NAD(P)-dependent dehydrogenase (short-subunit alcohol dehydrogenase family)